MSEWPYWQKVIIVMLTIIVVVLGYRRLLRYLGGNSRFDDHFAFLHPLEQINGQLIVRFELPEKDTVSLEILDDQSKVIEVVFSGESLTSGEHRYEINTLGWNTEQLELHLQSGNQKIVRYFKRKN